MPIDFCPAFAYNWGVTSLLPNTVQTDAPRRATASLSLLAKLLASENVRVEHNHRASTASFDTKSRVLILPVWKDMSGDLYDMLVAHEVGHALYSPKGDEWCKQLEKLVPGKFNKIRSYVNIVEDARIERMMKTNYPGLRSNFARAYRDLAEKNPKLFGLDQDVNTLALIDRVNIHYKVGFSVKVEFSPEELDIVKRVAETETWDEVVALAKELYDLSKKQKEEQKEEQDGEEESSASQDGQDQDDSDDTQTGNDTDDQENLESQEKGETEAEGENEEGGESTEDGEESDSDSDDADGEETDSDDDDGEANGQDGKKDSKSDQESKSNKDSKVKPETLEEDADESITEKLMDELSKQNATNDHYSSTGQVTLPVYDLESGIIKFADVIEDLKLIAERNRGFEKYQQFLAKNKPAVSALVQEFMRRKAANESQRTRTADTGNIDPSRLWAYKISEEIFGSYEIKAEGKNHGIVFLLDWSGSMNGILKDTVEQLGCLVQFCSSAGIPCEVYAFSDNSFFGKGQEESRNMWSKNAGQIMPKDMWLLNVLSSSARPAQIKTAIAGLLAWATKSDLGWSSREPLGRNVKNENFEEKYMLNGTPLNSALIAMNTVIPNFQKRTGVQIVNLCVLTDGDATDGVGYQWNSDGGSCSVYTSESMPRDSYGRDRREVFITGKKAVEKLNDTPSIVRFIRAETGANAMCFRIDQEKSLAKTVGYGIFTVNDGTNEKKVINQKGHDLYLKEKTKFLKDNEWVSGEEWFGYTEWFGIANLVTDDTNYLDKVTGESTKAALAKALSAEIGKTKNSRPLMARIAQRVSVKSK